MGRGWGVLPEEVSCVQSQQSKQQEEGVVGGGGVLVTESAAPMTCPAEFPPPPQPPSAHCQLSFYFTRIPMTTARAPDVCKDGGRKREGWRVFFCC